MNGTPGEKYQATRWYNDDPDRDGVSGQRYADKSTASELDARCVSTLYAFSPNVEAETIAKTKSIMAHRNEQSRVIYIVAKALGSDRWDADHWIEIQKVEDDV